jgi:hypothetical protein
MVVKDGFILQPDKKSQTDEAAWQDWLAKNKAQDRFRYKRRLRVMALVAVFVTLIALLWKLVA